MESTLLPSIAYHRYAKWMDGLWTGSTNGLTAGDPTDGSSGIKAFVLNFDEESNSISTINPDAPAASDSWFTLDGRRLLDEPVQKGMYIHDERKVMIK